METCSWRKAEGLKAILPLLDDLGGLSIASVCAHVLHLEAGRTA